MPMFTCSTCPSQAHKTTSYVFLLLLLTLEGSVVDGGALTIGGLVLRLVKGGGRRGVVLHPCEFYI